LQGNPRADVVRTRRRESPAATLGRRGFTRGVEVVSCRASRDPEVVGWVVYPWVGRRRPGQQQPVAARLDRESKPPLQVRSRADRHAVRARHRLRAGETEAGKPSQDGVISQDVTRSRIPASPVTAGFGAAGQIRNVSARAWQVLAPLSECAKSSSLKFRRVGRAAAHDLRLVLGKSSTVSAPVPQSPIDDRVKRVARDGSWISSPGLGSFLAASSSVSRRAAAQWRQRLGHQVVGIAADWSSCLGAARGGAPPRRGRMKCSGPESAA